MEEDYKLFQLIRRNPINNCVDLSKNMIGKRSGFIYFTENFRIDFENKMANQARLQEENERLQKENEELIELKISASAEYQIHNLQEENKRYKSENETLKCSIAVANKLEELIKEDFMPKGKIVDIIEKEEYIKANIKDIFDVKMHNFNYLSETDWSETQRIIDKEVANILQQILQELLESEETNDKNNKKG